jgi:hypothetical protein
MSVYKVVFVVVALAVLSASAGAKSTKMVGAVASVTSTSLDVLTPSEGTRSVRLGATTQYMRWITQKPWQSGEAGFANLNVGRCVEVDLRSADTNEAKTVWINMEPTGSMGDPCHTFRK